MKNFEPSNPDQQQAVLEKIDALTLEHRDLDDIIHQVDSESYVDQLQLKRLKKRKLLLKDRIERLKSQLLPDILA